MTPGRRAVGSPEPDVVRARRRGAIACLLLGLATACGSGGGGEESDERRADPVPLAILADSERTAHAELPGIRGLDALDAGLRQRVLDQANRLRCDCGCLGHSLARCLDRAERCEVALRVVQGYVDDARAFQLAGGVAVTDEPAAGSEGSGTADLDEGGSEEEVAPEPTEEGEATET